MNPPEPPPAPIVHPSPNHGERKLPISMVVIHYTGMETGQAALERLCDPAAEVSAHYVIEEDGRLFQLVEEDRRAWHAGVGYWRGVTDVNSASIGIELVNPGEEFGYRPFPMVQIEALMGLLSEIKARHGISSHNVVGHADIAPGRKADPGEYFPWPLLAEAGLALSTPPVATPSQGDFFEACHAIGYAHPTDLERGAGILHGSSAEADIVKAFRMRFTPQDITSSATAELTGLAEQVAAPFIET